MRYPRLQRLFISLTHLLSLIFLLLVLIGNVDTKPVIRSIYFLKIDLSDVIPRAVPDAALLNSIARSIGLHDFYQVGLWNYCAGYLDSGVTECSKADSWYWFNPAEVILSELLAGATLVLPAELNDILDLIRIASHWMFGLFISGAVFTFLCIFVAPFGVSTKPRARKRGRRIFLRSGPPFVLSSLAAISTTGASILATAMFTIFKNVMTAQQDLNIGGEVGTSMLAFMWIASAFAIFGYMWQAVTCCCVCCLCCTSRDRETGADSDHAANEKIVDGQTKTGKSRVKFPVGLFKKKGNQG